MRLTSTLLGAAGCAAFLAAPASAGDLVIALTGTVDMVFNPAPPFDATALGDPIVAVYRLIEPGDMSVATEATYDLNLQFSSVTIGIITEPISTVTQGLTLVDSPTGDTLLIDHDLPGSPSPWFSVGADDASGMMFSDRDARQMIGLSVVPPWGAFVLFEPGGAMDILGTVTRIEISEVPTVVGTPYCPGDGIGPHTACLCGNNNDGSMGGCELDLQVIL